MSKPVSMMKQARMEDPTFNPLGVPDGFAGASATGHTSAGSEQEGGMEQDLLHMLGEVDGEVYEDDDTGDLFVLTQDGRHLPIFLDEATGELSVALPEEILEQSDEDSSENE